MKKEKVTKHTNWTGEIFCYKKNGKLLKTFSTKEAASIELTKSLGMHFNSALIGYASLGQYSYIGNHTYKGLIFFNKQLDYEEISLYRRNGLFN